MRRSTVIGDHFDRDQTCQHSIVSVAMLLFFMNASQNVDTAPHFWIC